MKNTTQVPGNTATQYLSSCWTPLSSSIRVVMKTQSTGW